MELKVATIRIDGLEYEVDGDRNLLDACLSLGLHLPYFCWHPALGSVGACRQCAVKQFRDEDDEQGKLVMACMTPAKDGTRIAIEDPEAREFRSGVIEGMMLNHPHDCPVCDEGGECHLQDMTVMSGHRYRRYEGRKRTFENQDLGPLIHHEMNRCIQCYRCVRFYREHAGGQDLHAFGGRNLVYFGREQDGVLQSEFAGNLVEICPTGVFTDATLRSHYTRKWDLQMAPSVCVHCGLGCSTTVGERYGSLRRVLNRYHHEVNGFFLCDRGRFGYEFVNSRRRIRRCLLRREDGHEPVSGDAAVAHLAGLLASPERVVAIGSPRASLEANFALRQLAGPERFFLGIPDREAAVLRILRDGMREGPPPATLRGIEGADAVLVLGEDLTQTAPRMALAVRQAARRGPMRRADALQIPRWHDQAVREAIQDDTGPIYVATPQPTKLDDVATSHRLSPAGIALLGNAVAHALDPEAPAAEDLASGETALAGEIAQALVDAERPVVIAGSSLQDASTVSAAINVARALQGRGRPVTVGFVVPECNSLGLVSLGGRPLEEAAAIVERNEANVLIVLENDLFRRLPPRRAEALLEAAGQVVVLDGLAHRTGELADLHFAAGTFAETDGTLVSGEGRAQRFYGAIAPEEAVRPSWRWLRDAGRRIGSEEMDRWERLDDVTAALARKIPALRAVAGVIPDPSDPKAPRQPHRYSGRTAMRADRDVRETRPPRDPDAPLAFSMEGAPVPRPPRVNAFFWTPGFNSIQATFLRQREVGGRLEPREPTVRLLEGDGGGEYLRPADGAPAPREGEWQVIPLHHLFGSDELSGEAPAVQALAPDPYVALGTGDAAALGVSGGEELRLEIDGTPLRLPARILPGLPRGVAGLPAGLPGLAGLPLPAPAAIRKPEADR
ncbi:MAG: NADH-quinone oxidoreductase subunit NuoG [Acidobacteriota bacterium]